MSNSMMIKRHNTCVSCKYIALVAFGVNTALESRILLKYTVDGPINNIVHTFFTRTLVWHAASQ